MLHLQRKVMPDAPPKALPPMQALP